MLCVCVGGVIRWMLNFLFELWDVELQLLMYGEHESSPCRLCMVVSCVHPLAVLNAALCMTCSFLMLVKDARGGHMEETYS